MLEKDLNGWSISYVLNHYTVDDIVHSEVLEINITVKKDRLYNLLMDNMISPDGSHGRSADWDTYHKFNINNFNTTFPILNDATDEEIFDFLFFYLSQVIDIDEETLRVQNELYYQHWLEHPVRMMSLLYDILNNSEENYTFTNHRDFVISDTEHNSKHRVAYHFDTNKFSMRTTRRNLFGISKERFYSNTLTDNYDTNISIIMEGLKVCGFKNIDFKSIIENDKYDVRFRDYMGQTVI